MSERRRARRYRTRLAPDVRWASILDAATNLVVRHGAAALTMEDVAREEDVAKGTVYLYFDSIEDLIAALRARYAESLMRELGPLLPTGGSGSRLRRLDAFIAGTANVYEATHQLHHALFEEAGASEAPLIEAFRALLRAFIADGRDAGEFSVPNLDLATAFLLAGVHAVLSEGLHEGSKTKAVAAAQKLARRALTTT
jgi:TetR/AcrR family transcriptional regulator, transcriptional repressor for nem operon